MNEHNPAALLAALRDSEPREHRKRLLDVALESVLRMDQERLRMERALDEIVRDSMEEAQLAQAVIAEGNVVTLRGRV